MPDLDAAFLRLLAKANIALIAAHQENNPQLAIDALKLLLDVVVEHSNRGSRRDAALRRAIEIGG